jgi:hypothetical protein
MGVYWLTYKRNGRLAGVAIVSADSLIAARRAAAHWIGIGVMQFAEGHVLASTLAALVPQGYIGRMLSRREAADLLQRIEREAGNVR